MLCIPDYSINYQSFFKMIKQFYSNDQTVLFLTIQFCIGYLFVLSLNVEFDP